MNEEHNALKDYNLRFEELGQIKKKCVCLGQHVREKQGYFFFFFFNFLGRITVIDLITAHAPISAQSINLFVFRLQPVYFYLLL